MPSANMDGLQKVRITQSSLPSYWYASRIGEIFNVVPYPDNPKFYITPDNDGIQNFGILILQSDCEILLD